MLLYALTIFTAAALLFEIEPMIGKIIVPWFGGSAAVWSTCLLYFQVALLFGYLYAHLLVNRLSARTQMRIHIALLIASLISLPVIPSPSLKPPGDADPVWPIILVLTATIGFPFFLLSATGTLLQAWFARTNPRSTPYRLFALSNAGSMLALLSYPFVIEPTMRVRNQAWWWSALYGVFVVLCSACAWRAGVHPESRFGDEAAEQPPCVRWSRALLWIGLAACPSGMLLAITTEITHNIAPMPLLWIFPLALYLFSFILCFESDRFYRRRLFVPLLGVALVGMGYLTYDNLRNPKLTLALWVFGAGLFVCAMACHGELAHLRPDTSNLTRFYVCISFGGALGGLFVAFIAPNLFSDYIELPILLVLCAGLVAIVVPRLWPARALMLAATATLALYLHSAEVTQSRRFIHTARNFYGVLHIEDSVDADGQNGVRYLLNGSIDHGSQLTDYDSRRKPISYYGPKSGIARAINYERKKGPLRVGVVGLGAGVLASYCRAGDLFRFYELNPLDVEFAYRYFTYLKDCPSKPNVLLGDARLTLEREPPQRFDVIAIDAFSSDSIPVHLLTREAFELYARHLASDGFIAVHVSNRYLDLAPVVVVNAHHIARNAVAVNDQGTEEKYYAASDWVLVHKDPSSILDPAFEDPSVDPIAFRPNLPEWTDDYSNLFRALK